MPADLCATAHPDVQPGLHGAFMREGFGVAPHAHAPRGDAPLAGLRLAVKDVFDVAGLRTGGGSPVWAASRAPAAHSAIAVRLLLEAGAQWVGKTVTDELTYSLAGINAHHGTPVNASAPERLPGGSSSGSAAAVAAGHADIGLGTDCGGSIRVPASYCGLWGLRPTHGRIATNGCFTLAHSFDTVGWFARDARVLARVLQVLAHTRMPEAPARPPLVVAPDLAPLLDDGVRDHWDATLGALRAVGFAIEAAAAGTLSPADWATAFRPLQAAEVWQQHGEWFGLHGATLGTDVGARFRRAGEVSSGDVAAAQRVRRGASAVLAHLLAGERWLLLPTVPTPAPRRDDSPERVDEVRVRSQGLLCMAGLAGLPQVSLPWVSVDGAPVGLSLVGARGSDEALLAAAAAVHAGLAEPA